MKQHWTNDSSGRPTQHQRTGDRRPIRLPARLTWKDQRGTTRFASVVTRDISEFGVYVECFSAVSIPLYRLVQFQLESQERDVDGVPTALRSGRVLSAVYRVSPQTRNGNAQGLALRLMVDPKRHVAPIAVRATA